MPLVCFNVLKFKYLANKVQPGPSSSVTRRFTGIPRIFLFGKGQIIRWNKIE
jgi:hypothetical protein